MTWENKLTRCWSKSNTKISFTANTENAGNTTMFFVIKEVGLPLIKIVITPQSKNMLACVITINSISISSTFRDPEIIKKKKKKNWDRTLVISKGETAKPLESSKQKNKGCISSYVIRYNRNFIWKYVSRRSVFRADHGVQRAE